MKSIIAVTKIVRRVMAIIRRDDLTIFEQPGFFKSLLMRGTMKSIFIAGCGYIGRRVARLAGDAGYRDDLPGQVGGAWRRAGADGLQDDCRHVG